MMHTMETRFRRAALRPGTVLLVAAVLLTFGVGDVRGEDEGAAVIAANEAFYQAFSRRDLAAMDGLWAKDLPVVVIHPGWPGVHGREAVMASWDGIFRGPNSPIVRAIQPRAHVYGETASVVCYEAIGGGLLIATNVFVKQDGSWKLVHHRAGPTSAVLSSAPELGA